MGRLGRGTLVLAVALAVASILAAWPAAGRGAGQAAPAAGTPCPGTAAAENEALVRRYLAEVWGQGDLGAVGEVLAPDHVHHQPRGAVTQDPAALAASAREFRAAFPDFRTAVDEVITAGDRVVVRWTRMGTHLGPFRGLAPTGRAVEWTGIWIARVACGRVAETWSEADVLGLYRQLGLAIDGRADAAPATPLAGGGGERGVAVVLAVVVAPPCPGGHAPAGDTPAGTPGAGGGGGGSSLVRVALAEVPPCAGADGGDATPTS